jgi:mRNA-degrading endonuclease RelE of RelBE toxin-antitoxin system
MTKPIISIGFAEPLVRKVKNLRKKYRHVQEDVRSLTDRLREGETPGDRLQGLPYVVYKVRIENRDLQRGKSGGYRVVYYLKTAERIILIMIYPKTEQADLSREVIRKIIDELELDELSDTDDSGK